QSTNLKAGEFREFVESVSQEFPSLNIIISQANQELFHFGQSHLLNSCSTMAVQTQLSSVPLNIKICKALATKLSALIPLLVSFLLVVFAITLLARQVEDDAKEALQRFMREAG